MSENSSISVRTSRLNNIILGKSENSGNSDNAFCEAISKEGLLDTLLVLYDECSKDVIRKKDKNVADFVAKYRPIIKETKNLRVNLNDFDVKILIGKGYFGEVHLVTEKQTGEIYAMKKMRKSMLTTSQINEERDIMASRQSEWVTSLQYAFQDQECLYLVMEYLPGGDLLSLMIRIGVFDEELAQFYLAELTEALHGLHSMGYVHRDIKPENILLDRFGHLKLADFGNATVINKDGSVTSMTPVGTPDYIAPELLQTLSTAIKSTTSHHDVTCDFWSMGIIGYEFVAELTPFHDDNVNETYSKILSHCEGRFPNKLTYPHHVQISSQYRDLIDRLVTKSSNRLMYDDIKHHPFFSKINWDKLRYNIPPIIPSVASDDDTSNFEDVDKSTKRNTFLNKSTFTITKVNDFSGQNLPFLGYTYVYEDFDMLNKFRDNDEQMASARLSQRIKEQDKILKEHVGELHQLQRELLSKERKMANMNAQNKILNETKKELENMKDKLKEKTAELAASRTDIKTLRGSLKIEEEQRLKNDATIADVLRQTYKKWEKAKQASDQNYEKQIAERKTDLALLLEKMRANTSELNTKVEECSHLQSTVENYKELLKKSKDQHNADKNEHDRNRRQLIDLYEAKIVEFKQKLKGEKDLRTKQIDEIKEIQKELEESEISKRSVVQVQKNFDKNVDDMKKRLSQQLEENQMLREAKLSSDKTSEELQQKCDDLRKDISKLQEQLSSSAASSNRSSLLSSELDFKSANTSLQELNAGIEEQLKNDLIRAKESETMQRKRAEGLEEMVGRLEKLIETFKVQTAQPSHGAETLLEKQNEKLEDKLSAIREQSIIDRQSARTANLSLWKLEKELDSVKLDKNCLNRRVELAEERINKMKIEKDEAEFKIKQHKETIVIREKQIEDFKDDIKAIKEELKKERSLWNTSEKDRLQEKTELIECISKIQSLEEKLGESRLKYNSGSEKLKMLTNENNRLVKELREVHEALSDSYESNKEIKNEFESVNRNFNMLKDACNITEVQLTELETMLETEIQRNKSNSEKIDGLWKQIREKESEIIKLKQDLNQERASKTMSESKNAHMYNECEEIRKKFEDLQLQMVEQQKELIEKTSHLFAVQERIEILNSDTSNLQRITANYEQEHHILKEENCKILTDLYLAKEHITKLNNEIKDHKNKINELTNEMDHVKGVLNEQKTFYTERDIKSEATLAQHKKLIDYLQAKVEENSHKKKKTLGDILFGGSSDTKKENISPNATETTMKYKKLEDELQKERARNNQLKEQLLKAKTEMITLQNTSKSIVKHQEPLPEIVPKPIEQKAQPQRVETVAKSPVTNQSHSFEMTLETSSSKTPVQMCTVCDRHILAGHPYWKCKSCAIPIHRKCRTNVLNDCKSGKSEIRSHQREEIESANCDEKADEGDEKYVGDLLFKRSKMEPALIVNDIYDVHENIVLLACETGLYSFNQENNEYVHIKGITNLKSFAISPTSPKSILIGSNGEYLYQCDLRHLQSRAQASSCLSPTLECSALDLSIANRSSSERWHLVKMAEDNSTLSEAVAIAATSSRIVILKFNSISGKFKPVRGLDTVKPVTSVLFTKHTAIVSSDKFFEIDLNTYAAEQFLDMSDVSIQDARSCTPMAAFKVNSQEFLLCFKEFGLFVDEYGCRSRPENVNWMHEPMDFKYRESCLFIAHRESLQVMYLSKSYTKDLQRQDKQSDRRSFLNLNAPQLLSFVEHNKRTNIYVASTSASRGQQIFVIDGCQTLKSISPSISNSLETLSSITSYATTGQSLESLSTIGQSSDF